MHPDNMTPMDPSKGKLYLRTPDGQEAELVYNLAEITPAQENHIAEAVAGVFNLPPDLPEIRVELSPGPAYDAWMQGMVQSYHAQLAQEVNRRVSAMADWARENRPEWLHVMRRTKKGRTRKKYAQRILRAYREEACKAVAAGIITPNEARRRMGPL